MHVCSSDDDNTKTECHRGWSLTCWTAGVATQLFPGNPASSRVLPWLLALHSDAGPWVMQVCSMPICFSVTLHIKTHLRKIKCKSKNVSAHSLRPPSTFKPLHYLEGRTWIPIGSVARRCGILHRCTLDIHIRQYLGEIPQTECSTTYLPSHFHHKVPNLPFPQNNCLFIPPDLMLQAVRTSIEALHEFCACDDVTFLWEWNLITQDDVGKNVTFSIFPIILRLGMESKMMREFSFSFVDPLYCKFRTS